METSLASALRAFAFVEGDSVRLHFFVRDLGSAAALHGLVGSCHLPLLYRLEMCLIGIQHSSFRRYCSKHGAIGINSIRGRSSAWE